VAKSVMPHLGHLDAVDIALAVLEVYRANAEELAEHVGGMTALHSSWVVYSGLRRDLFERTLACWQRRTGRPADEFPYSEDGVARLYLLFASEAQASPSSLDAWEQELKVSC
jgi:hypothetical protein